MRLEYAVKPYKIALILGVIALYFAAQSLVAEYLIEKVLDKEAHRSAVLALDLFSVNAEQTIPTWYSVLLLFAASILLAFIATAKRANQERYVLHWLGLAVVFLYLSMDEGAVIHEIVADSLQTTLNTTGYLAFAWQIVAVPLLILFGLVYLRFLFHLPSRTRNLFVLSGLVYIGGALVVEAVSANQWYLGGGVTFEYLAIATVEELAEMLGVLLFIYTLLSYAVAMQYGFAFHSQPLTQEVSASLSHAVSTPSSRKLLGKLSQVRPVTWVIVFIVGANLALIYWAFSQAPAPRPIPQSTAVPIQAVIDQLATDDVLVTRMVGTFGVDNLTSRQVTASLLAIFDEVMVVTLPTAGLSIVLAAPDLPFDRDSLSEVLRANGITQFIIFETASVKAIVGDIQPPIQDK
jgi:hypothetical protein